MGGGHLARRLDLLDGRGHQFIHGAADLVVGLVNGLGVEIARILRNTSSSPASWKSAITTDLA